jgi:hypothetical protein
MPTKMLNTFLNFLIYKENKSDSFSNVGKKALVREMQRARARVDDEMMAGCARG